METLVGKQETVYIAEFLFTFLFTTYECKQISLKNYFHEYFTANLYCIYL